MASKLEIADRLVGDVLVLTLSGQMLLDDGDLAFGRRIDDFISRGIVKFVVDLGAVTYDSAGRLATTPMFRRECRRPAFQA